MKTNSRSMAGNGPAVPPFNNSDRRDSVGRSRLQQWLAALLLVLLPGFAFADGRMFPATAMPAHVNIPDQRALIHYSNGVERLVIETRFTGAGTNFAWVVPFPAPPVVEPASTGLFPTLQVLFQPRLEHRVAPRAVGILFLVWLGYALLFVRPTGRLGGLDWAISGLVALGILLNFPHPVVAVLGSVAAIDLLLLLLPVRYWRATRKPLGTLDVICILLMQFLAAALLMPALAKAGSNGVVIAADSADSVSVLDRQIVGIFETTTLASRDPKALQTWLEKNGFAPSSDCEPVIASYVRDGWVFVASKVRRDATAPETSTPHPLSFTFKTERPVYPMRLTGVGNGTLAVDLYVFGPARAAASHFAVDRCARPEYPDKAIGWSHPLPTTLRIAHPLLRQWVNGAPVATKLTAKLTPEDMRQDVWIDWVPFKEKVTRVYSEGGAWTEALNQAAA